MILSFLFLFLLSILYNSLQVYPHLYKSAGILILSPNQVSSSPWTPFSPHGCLHSLPVRSQWPQHLEEEAGPGHKKSWRVEFSFPFCQQPPQGSLQVPRCVGTHKVTLRHSESQPT